MWLDLWIKCMEGNQATREGLHDGDWDLRMNLLAPFGHARTQQDVSLQWKQALAMH